MFYTNSAFLLSLLCLSFLSFLLPPFFGRRIVFKKWQIKQSFFGLARGLHIRFPGVDPAVTSRTGYIVFFSPLHTLVSHSSVHVRMYVYIYGLTECVGERVWKGLRVFVLERLGEWMIGWGLGAGIPVSSAQTTTSAQQPFSRLTWDGGTDDDLTTSTNSTTTTTSTRRRNRRAPVGWQGRAWVLNDNEDDNEDDDDDNDDDNDDNNLTASTSRHRPHGIDLTASTPRHRPHGIGTDGDLTTSRPRRIRRQ
ncbi:hypothetical protein BP00DRAFT_201086 [Aspergillus indologenus CBS 114.80]|uniref:Uncharacterized protein n=1 Tax=Aspergillus indologenus CBS 114.80 TaxID=1450541 RepID=A0A2V5I169_9EURO|nr:hypothetical protein BP00DRAFT_201086 [Aspergillus indologenus CBS 114.80]